jgi:xanthosine utilization system XapX-like protein
MDSDDAFVLATAFVFGIIYSLIELTFVHAPTYLSFALGLVLVGVAYITYDWKLWGESILVAAVTTFLTYNLWEYLLRL